MAKFNPRYGTNTGYAAGDMLFQLGQLLRQGIGDYERQTTVDEESKRRDADYLLRLQEFLSRSEDRDLDRQVKSQALAGVEEDRAGRRKATADAAALKALGLSGRGKLMNTDPDVEEAVPPPPAFAADPERLQPNVLQSLTKRPRTKQELAKASGASLEEQAHPDFMTLLKDLVKEPKAPHISTRNPEHDIVVDGKVTEPGTPKAAAPPKPFFEGKTETELELIVADPSVDPAQKAQARAALQSIRAAALDRAKNQGAIAAENAAGRAVGPQPITAEERQRVAEGQRSSQLATRSLATLKQHPDWIGGPLGLQGRAREWQAALGQAPAGFAEFQADIQEIYGTYARRIAGAALTPTEKSTYLSYLPNITTDSDQQFLAKLKSFPERVQVIDAAIEKARLGTSAPGAKGPAIDMDAVNAELRKRGLLR